MVAFRGAMVSSRSTAAVCLVVISCATLSAAFSVGSSGAPMGLRTQFGAASCPVSANRDNKVMLPPTTAAHCHFNLSMHGEARHSRRVLLRHPFA